MEAMGESTYNARADRTTARERQCSRGRYGESPLSKIGAAVTSSINIPGRIFLALCACSVGSLSLAPSVAKAESRPASSELTSFSIEDLMNIQVTSVAKKPQRIADTAAAIFVITSEDIRRSGMSSVPELLRTVPGVTVGQIDANKWAISVRGFNGQFANKLQVLIDGRSVYTSWFAGVYWDVQDLVLADIERIEVIRGPGATLWGANAVNGVINIITKHSQDTQGTLVSARAGNVDGGALDVRYGGKLGDTGEVGTYRIYAKGAAHNNMLALSGDDAHDRWRNSRVGFRLDMKASAMDTLQMQGDIYTEHFDQTAGNVLAPSFSTFPDQGETSGGHLLARWRRAYSDTSQLDATFYYDSTRRRSVAGGEELLDVYDLDLQHHFKLSEAQDVVWGLGYRTSNDRFVDSFTVAFVPNSRKLHLLSAFVQDEIALRDDLHLTVGSKLEHNSFTGLEVQPNVRVLWKLNERNALWGAVSRAVRSPTRNDTAVRLNIFEPPILLQGSGNPNFVSEKVLSYELGYRSEPSKRLSFDVTTFYNELRKLFSIETGTPSFGGMPPLLILPQTIDNRGSGHTYGAETSARWQATDDWNISGSYSWLQMRLQRDAGSNDMTVAAVAGANPTHQWQLTSRFNVTKQLEFDTSFYHVSALPEPGIPAYTRTDLRLGWRPSPPLEVSVGVQNLFDRGHPEFASAQMNVLPSQVPRNVYATAVWRF